MTASTTKIERSAPAIRAVLAEVSPREQEAAQVAAAESGDFTGLRSRDEHGNWVQL
jgi:hypothetical protein